MLARLERGVASRLLRAHELRQRLHDDVVVTREEQGKRVALLLDLAHSMRRRDQRTEPFTWRFWSYDWRDAKEGEHTLVSRAIDARGRVQPAADDPSIKNKKTYWEANQQWPRKVRI